MRHYVGIRDGLAVRLSVGHRVVLREGLIFILSVELVVGRIVRLSAGLSINMSGWLDVFVKVRPDVGFIVIQSIGRYMVGISVVIIIIIIIIFISSIKTIESVFSLFSVLLVLTVMHSSVKNNTHC